MTEIFYYVGLKPGFRQGLGPNDPDPDTAVLVFLTSGAASQYIVDNNLEAYAHVYPVTINSDPVVVDYAPNPLQLPLNYEIGDAPGWCSDQVTCHDTQALLQ